jgi:hypothetical protein
VLKFQRNILREIALEVKAKEIDHRARAIEQERFAETNR